MGALLGPVFTKLVYPIRFHNSPAPQKSIYVKPEMIGGWYPGSRFRELSFLGRIRNGNWHENVIPRNVMLSGSSKINSTIAHLRDGVPWIDTPLFKERYAKVASSEDLARKAKEYDRFDQLFEEIKAGGFRVADRRTRPMFVHIGPRGQIYWTSDGNHRFAMAMILGLEVPVLVLNRHMKWQKFRETAFLKRDSLPEDLIDHPDLQDLR